MSYTSQLMRMQQVLVDAGYDIGRYGSSRNGVDGIMGTKTAEAMRLYQIQEPELYKRFINMDTSDLPRPKGRPSLQITSTPKQNNNSTKTAEHKTSVQPKAVYNKSEYGGGKNETLESELQNPKVSTSPQNSNSTQQAATAISKFGNDYYDRDENIITYEGKRYTPYQFFNMVKTIDNSPMSNIHGASESMLGLLNSALNQNGKKLYKGKNGYGEWVGKRRTTKDQNAYLKFLEDYNNRN